MARKSHFDFYLELLNRCLLAWEALRLNPKYREEYKEHQSYIEWAKKHYGPDFFNDTSSKKELLYRFSQRWGLSVDDVLRCNPTDNTQIPLTINFRTCKKKCVKPDINLPWGFTLECTANKPKASTCFRQYRQAILALPFTSRLNNVYVYPGDPMPGRKQHREVLSFIKREQAASRILLWVRGDTLREIAEWQILAHISRVKARNTNRRSEGKAAATVIPDGGYLIFSISQSAAASKIISSVKKNLKRAIRAYPFSQAFNIMKALEAYELRIHKKYPVWKIVQKRYKKVGLAEHREIGTSGGVSFYGRRITGQIARARRLIEKNLIPPPQLTRPTMKQELSADTSSKRT